MFKKDVVNRIIVNLPLSIFEELTDYSVVNSSAIVIEDIIDFTLGTSEVDMVLSGVLTECERDSIMNKDASDDTIKWLEETLLYLNENKSDVVLIEKETN